ncbi:MAG TPA: outer membrane protein assembly factor BamC [Candidatus Competibacteraceae bacterium]|nr:outer membrane protein assembly factor BamC [Candidatus Competibacteraceae bacterium]
MQQPRLTRVLLLALGVVTLAACSSSGSIIPDRRPDYRNSKLTSPLEVPPDLTNTTIDETLVVPEINPSGSASLSDYASERSDGRVAGAEAVLVQPDSMVIKNEGGRRWLQVEASPEVLWPRLKDFWLANGLTLAKEDPRTGIMETEWAENRADIPEDLIRSVLKKALDFAYSAPTRDKFKLRLERMGSGTAVFLTHYGMQEVSRGRDGETIVWEPRPADPELEAEMLNRLMVSLGASEKRAAAELAKSGQSTAAANASRVLRQPRADGTQQLLVAQDYDTTWRRVGLALDSGNFTVEDQDRQNGLYLVEYRERDDNGGSQKSGGVLSRLMFWRSDQPDYTPGTRHKVRLAGQGDKTIVLVQDSSGQPDRSDGAKLILDILERSLR